MRRKQKVFKLVRDISLRREDFGGLAFVPITGEIIQLNHAAYELLKDIIKEEMIKPAPEDLFFWQELNTKGIVEGVIVND